VANKRTPLQVCIVSGRAIGCETVDGYRFSDFGYISYLSLAIFPPHFRNLSACTSCLNGACTEQKVGVYMDSWIVGGLSDCESTLSGYTNRITHTLSSSSFSFFVNQSHRSGCSQIGPTGTS